jgi:HEXXH motif-containing protein
MNEDYSLAEFAFGLEWGELCLAIATEWKGRYLQFLRERWSSVAEADGTELLAQCSEALTESELDSLLIAPDVSWRLIEIPDDAETQWALKAAAYNVLTREEQGRNGNDPSLSASLEEGCYLVSGMLVDSHSVYVCPPRMPNELPLTAVSGEEDQAFRSTMASALSLLEQQHAVISGFVRRMTTRLVLRVDPSMPKSLSSCSFRSHAGMSLIVNPKTVTCDELRLLDSIVHESIHSAIYMYEPVVAPLCLPVVRDLQLHSPWTGRLLTVDQFVQACFVWWGLMKMWQAWCERDTDPRAVRLFERAARGFSARPVSHLLRGVGRGCVEPRTLDALNLVEERATC